MNNATTWFKYYFMGMTVVGDNGIDDHKKMHVHRLHLQFQ
jgi:hypothetical protein